jgi:glycerophosphoryl diester phosphodiesterase
MSMHTVLVDAHRGASARCPENTLAAFRAAVEAGADSVEFDIRLSADGEVVAIHDSSVDRTTDGRGEVHGLTLAELRSLDAGSWKSPDFAGERIPTLDEALAELALAPRINVELKTEDPRIAERTAEAIERRRLHHRIMVSSFHLPHLLAIKNRLPGVWTHLFLEEWLSEGFWEGEGRFINSVGLPYEQASEGLVRAIQDQGRAVWVFTVDEERDALELAAAGVQAITTNRPAAIIRALSEAGYR